jgi:hypothetical protein
MDFLSIYLSLFPESILKLGGGQQWPLPDEELGLVIDEREEI